MTFARAVFRLAFVASLVAPSVAAATDDTAAPVAEEKRGPLFPPFRKKDRAERDRKEDREDRKAEEAPAAPPITDPAPVAADGPAPDAPAAEAPPTGGVWEWVDRMDGEIPSAEQVAAIREVDEEHELERGLVDDLAPAEAPLAFYDDPKGALAVDPLYLDLVDPSEFDIPVEVNPWVEKWVRYFTGDGRKYYERWLARSTRYQPMMRRELAKAGLPQDLVYLSMIESGYNAHAYSTADAAGLWQFITSTGKLYDLRIDYWVDERRDPEESVGAAIAFLSELHDMFGDWRLAWGGYNGGPGRIRRAVEKAGTKDWWTLADGAYLHPETDNYVPKIMAAAIIGHHPERYGFTNIPYQDELAYETARVDGSVELDVIARCAGVSGDDIRALNPALRRYATPPEGYDVRIPVGKRDTFLTALAAVPKAERITVARHTVRRGETLSIIAAKYGTSVSAISRANNLRNVNRITVGMSLVIPKSEAAAAAIAQSEPRSSSSSSSSSSRTEAPRPAPSRPTVHVVARGDTLSEIATRYGVSVGQLQAWNGIRGSTIVVGQRIKVSSGGSTGGSHTVLASTAGGASSSSSSSVRTHTVQRGETLSSIASRYGVTATDLQRLNGIGNASHIEVGQRLKVGSSGSASSSSWTTYTVQRGDSLGAIATRYNCSVADLRSWNGISGSVIQPGQKLRVRRA